MRLFIVFLVSNPGFLVTVTISSEYQCLSRLGRGLKCFPSVCVSLPALISSIHWSLSGTANIYLLFQMKNDNNKIIHSNVLNFGELCALGTRPSSTFPGAGVNEGVRSKHLMRSGSVQAHVWPDRSSSDTRHLMRSTRHVNTRGRCLVHRYHCAQQLKHFGQRWTKNQESKWSITPLRHH